ncbi:redoxin domain-containing protein [Candidatus Poribacteria bacterium]|nr:redoxin domain-containing protein [Candidatus Poribacteria bacterium]MBT5532660.1 redoxin domain-containing protein [Candidatus Poribacteria bacterium]MBT5709522.1 redoxin domain-containing protein [Candidatus Poribacteria bacterium]MBT7100251.1 redoxin domain-containing protein [Candidatus Poribacteria bacterium]MBT7803927.1 redoxin domain-containing protein [Candidatus Poribacteria bacterium]
MDSVSVSLTWEDTRVKEFAQGCVRVAVLAGALVFATSAGAARIGDVAPAFELSDTMDGLVRLADYAGAPTVLVFYRGFF